MQFTTFILSAVAATGAVALTTGSSSNSTTTTAWVTQTVTAYETYCPKKTTWTYTNGGKTKTYTGSKKQWVTVTDCPTAGCTISNKVGYKPTVVPVGYNPKYQNGTVPATPTAVPTPVYTPCPCSSSSATVINNYNNYNNGTSYGTSSTPASTDSCQCPVPNNNSGNTGSSNGANTGSGSGSSNSGNTGSGSTGSGSSSGSSSSGNGTSGPQEVTNGAPKALIGQAVTGLFGLAVVALIL
ncbi:hypothetical protein BDZ45DRAFT_733372 [Acephala macrosclerotiorum]|nr:hypothetical protein BDZ45DRAFT_733372 [Acephala macrosclerotiorum]